MSKTSRNWIIAAIVAAIALGGALLWGLLRGQSADPAATATDAATEVLANTPPQSALPAGTHMGTVELLVYDLDLVTAYYRDAVGLDVFDETEAAVTLGLDVPLISLVKTDLPEDRLNEAGMYHSAILYPDQASLAKTLMQIAATAPASFVGASDHSVSEAFYFNDPEGNGVELYADRPREDWVWNNGQAQMGSLPLDPNEFINEHLNALPSSGQVSMGHVHLRGGDLALARKFYVDGMGFAQTAASDGAVFFSADGYHHHVAVNTWTSAGAGQRPELAGIGSIEVLLPHQEAIDEVAARLARAGFEAETSDGQLTARDPWGIVIHVGITPHPAP